MKKRFLNILILLFALAIIVWPLKAQSPCTHLIFRLDTAVPIDQDALCEAAQPWADEGLRIFIFLTDDNPGSEDDWFALLDQVEADAGIRDLSQADSFSHDVLAIEASTANAVPWSPTITYGTWLFDTNLDTDATAVTKLKNDLRTAIQTGDVTAGLAQTLEQAYAINNPTPYGAIAAGGVAAALALGAAGFGGYKYVARPAMSRRRRRQAQLAHLGVIRQNIANLLLACDRLISGETIDDAVIYQLFAAYGGERYADRKKAVRNALKQSRAALRSAFDLRRTLEIEEEDPETAAKPLTDQIHNWEMIYLTLVGSSEDIHNLTEEELRDLLDPMIILEREARDVPMAEQLNDIRRQIEGMPFKITLQEVGPAKADKQGILGNLAQVEAQIADLMAAQDEAPVQLDEARRDHLAVKEAANKANPFGLTGSEIAAGVAASLDQAENDLAAGDYLKVMATAVTVQRDLDIIEDLMDAANDHKERQVEKQAILDLGYRPTTLAASKAEIEEDQRQIITHITSGNYLAGANWIDELDADSQRALDEAIAWQEQHQFNAEFLNLLTEKLAQLESELAQSTIPAWEKLSAYPEGNWASVTQGPEKAGATLQQLRQTHLPKAEQLNSLEIQQIGEAETLLAKADAALNRVESQLQMIGNRLIEVETAVAHIPEGLQLAAADLERAVQYRNSEDAKIGPEIDRQLAEAEKQLSQASQLTNEREFIAAAAAQTTARELATTAYAGALDQVKRINELQKQVQTARGTAVTQVNAAKQATMGLNALMQTNKTADLARDMANKLSSARKKAHQTLSLEDHALAEALATAVTAFTAAGEIAHQTSQQAQQDQKTYTQQQRAAQQAILDAQLAIQTADHKVRHRYAGRAGQQALVRAGKILPTMPDGRQATRPALERVKKQAQQAQTYAEEARRKAEQAIAIERRRREKPRPSSSGWVFPSGTSTSSSGSHKPRPRPRPSHSSSSSSHRPSASGSSRRSSSSGSSRRSSSGRSQRR